MAQGIDEPDSNPLSFHVMFGKYFCGFMDWFPAGVMCG
jgi:hypothetical protein